MACIKAKTVVGPTNVQPRRFRSFASAFEASPVGTDEGIYCRGHPGALGNQEFETLVRFRRRHAEDLRRDDLLPNEEVGRHARLQDLAGLVMGDDHATALDLQASDEKEHAVGQSSVEQRLLADLSLLNQHL